MSRLLCALSRHIRTGRGSPSRKLPGRTRVGGQHCFRPAVELLEQRLVLTSRTFTLNDPSFPSQQWGYNNLGQPNNFLAAGGKYGLDIDMPAFDKLFATVVILRARVAPAVDLSVTHFVDQRVAYVLEEFTRLGRGYFRHFVASGIRQVSAVPIGIWLAGILVIAGADELLPLTEEFNAAFGAVRRAQPLCQLRKRLSNAERH